MTKVELNRVPVILPDTLYDMWVRGELDEYLHIPDGHRVEIIGGELVVSPAPFLEHCSIAQDITDAVARARVSQQDYPWVALQGTGLPLSSLHDGYIPDVVILDAETRDRARAEKVGYLVPDQIELAAEITSRSNAGDDRQPGQRRVNPTKWQGYARVEIPYYLLIDADPKLSKITLYSIPDATTGAYLHQEHWSFGETIQLPDPFNLEIPTDKWGTWPEN